MSFKEAEYNEKIRNKHCLEDKKDALKSENAKIDEKIIRLEKAYRKINELKEKTTEMDSNIRERVAEGDSNYIGNIPDSIKDSCSEGCVHLAFIHYKKALDDIADDINWKIQDLNEQKASNEGFLAQVGAQLENIATWFKNTVN